MEYPRLGAKIGDRITFNLTTGPGLSGEVVDLDMAEDDGVRAIAIRDDPARPDPVWVRGDLIAFWRLGRPVVQQVQRLAVPVPNGLQLPSN